MKCLLAYFNMVTVSHKMVGLERISDYRGVRLQRFDCTKIHSVVSPYTPDNVTLTSAAQGALCVLLGPPPCAGCNQYLLSC